jgi:hypothetical protein
LPKLIPSSNFPVHGKIPPGYSNALSQMFFSIENKKRFLINNFPQKKKNEYIRTHVIPLKIDVLLHIQKYPLVSSSEF